MEAELICMLVSLLAGTLGVWLINIQYGKSLKRNNSICCSSRGNLLLITSLYSEWSHQTHRCCAASISVSISWLFGSADINVVSQHCKIAQGLLFCPSCLPNRLLSKTTTCWSFVRAGIWKGSALFQQIQRKLLEVNILLKSNLIKTRFMK